MDSYRYSALYLEGDMNKNDRFTFPQSLVNVLIAISVIVALAFSSSKEFYKDPVDLAVVITLLIVAIITLIYKKRQVSLEEKSSKEHK
jgi:uncharacterized membrane protein